jgi:hypothetical protein
MRKGLNRLKGLNLKGSFGVIAGLLALGLAFFAGCSQEPMAPQRSVALSVTMDKLESIHAALLGATQNEILYRVDGKGEAAQHFVYGPFSTPLSSGTVTFTVKVPPGSGSQVLSLQLNDASTHQPLAVGAAGFDFGAGLEGGVVVDMGSVTRTCYFTNMANTANPQYPSFSTGFTVSFESDAVATPGPVVDMSVTTCATCPVTNSYYFQGPLASGSGPPVTVSNIAYLGNGDLVDFDYVPPASSFFTTSLAAKGGAAATLQAGDIYCVQLQSPVGGHAWVQVTNPGALPTAPIIYGPGFRFRLNSTLPYYAYEQSTADQSGKGCTSY